MNSLKRMPIAVLFLVFILSVPQARAENASSVNIDIDNLSRHMRTAWTFIQGKVAEAAERLAKQPTLPNNAIFGESRASNTSKINDLLDELGKALLGSEAQDQLLMMKRLQAESVAIQNEIETMRHNLISAPESPTTLLDRVSTAFGGAATAEQYREMIRNKTAELESRRKATAQCRRRVLEEIASYGLDLDETQQEMLFSSVIGDDMVKNVVILNNITSILGKLSQMSSGEGRGLNSAKRYYETYLVFMDILIKVNSDTAENISLTWIPRLDEIVARARNVSEDARNSLYIPGLTNKQKAAYETNIRSNALTIKVGQLYSRFLARQKDMLDAKVESLRVDRAVGQNTLDTVTASGNLSELIQRSLRDLDALGDIIMPEMSIFENFEQRREFEELSRRMRGGEADTL